MLTVGPWYSIATQEYFRFGSLLAQLWLTDVVESHVNRTRKALIVKIALCLLWLNFIFLWYRTNHFTAKQEMTSSVVYLGTLLLLYSVLVTFWVRHNVGIYRKKGPRTRVREVPSLTRYDSLHRQISLKTDIESGREIHVTIVGNRKVFDGARPHHQPPIRKVS